MKTIMNLTPHAVNACGKTYPPTGLAARIPTRANRVGELDGIPVEETVADGPTEGLPAEDEATIYIVSQMVASRHPERADLVSPGRLLRDAAGNITGCASFIPTPALARRLLGLGTSEDVRATGQMEGAAV